MDEMEDKLSSILGNPQMMQQIMTMAQNLSQSQDAAAPPAEHPVPSKSSSPKQDPPKASTTPGGLDPGMLQRIYGIARQTGIDKNQQALLKALSPYLNTERIHKLEKAMRAAKIAGIASVALGSSGLPFLTGR